MLSVLHDVKTDYSKIVKKRLVKDQYTLIEQSPHVEIS